MKEYFDNDGLEKLLAGARNNSVLRVAALRCLVLAWWLEANADVGRISPLSRDELTRASL